MFRLLQFGINAQLRLEAARFSNIIIINIVWKSVSVVHIFGTSCTFLETTFKNQIVTRGHTHTHTHIHVNSKLAAKYYEYSRKPKKIYICVTAFSFNCYV